MLQDVPEPGAPVPGTATVRVRHVAVNRGELHRLRERPPGWRPGWDFAGEVVAAYDDSGPQPGDLVCGFLLEGAWAQLVNAPLTQLSRVPDGVDSATACCVPVAGLTARRVLRLAGHAVGELSGRRILVVGAAGGVGQFAVPLARLQRAEVFGLTSSSDRFDVIHAAGATPLLVEDLRDHPDFFDAILESAGGGILAAAVGALARRGVIVTYGNSARSDTTFPTSAFYEREGRLLGYHLLKDVADDPPRDDLCDLVALVARDELPVRHRAATSWTAVNAVLEDLAARAIDGKAVLEVEHDG
jgi:NADPH:quinone reductase